MAKHAYRPDPRNEFLKRGVSKPRPVTPFGGGFQGGMLSGAGTGMDR